MAISLISALEITEAELNPAGSDSGGEWVELFSEDEVNLSGYYFENNDGDVYNLSEVFSGYLAIDLEGQWLDNSDEKIILRSQNETIAETPVMEDPDNDEKTWGKCIDAWSIGNSSKGEENICETLQPIIENITNNTEPANNTVEIENISIHNLDNVDNSPSNEPLSDSDPVEIDSDEPEPIRMPKPVIEEKPTPIVLSEPPEHPVPENNEPVFESNESILRNWMVYSFFAFVFVAIALIAVLFLRHKLRVNFTVPVDQ